MEKTKQVKYDIISNYIEYTITDELQRDKAKGVAETYVKGDHVDEVQQFLNTNKNPLIPNEISKEILLNFWGDLGIIEHKEHGVGRLFGLNNFFIFIPHNCKINGYLTKTCLPIDLLHESQKIEIAEYMGIPTKDHKISTRDMYMYGHPFIEPEVKVRVKLTVREYVRERLKIIYNRLKIDIPQNHIQILEFCIHDVLDSAGTENWIDEDVDIAFKRFLELKTK